MRLVGLKEVVEGSDPIGFLKINLPKWIPSLGDRVIHIERAHRPYSNVVTEKDANHPRALIFKLLDDTDRNSQKEKEQKDFAPVHKMMTSLGLQPFLLYPAQLKISYRGRTINFRTPHEAEDFLQNTFHPPPALRRLEPGTGQ